MLLYGEESTTYGEPVELINYQVSESHAYRIKTLIGWGDVPGEFELFINDEIMAGCRTSNEKRTEQVWWGDLFICNSNDVVTIIGTHFVQGLRKLKCNLELVRL